MKKFFWLLAAAALALVSCEKETIDGKGDSSSSPSTSDVFYSVVSQLVNKNELVGDYSKKTFQPTIGIADGGDESVRVVATNSLEAAVNRYNTLTGASIDTNTVSHTFSDKAVGTLTWSKNTDNKAFGTVTASIPSVPTLQKIIYRAGDQGDVNGSFGVNGKATAYYRFGDVVKRTRKEDGVVEYWVCVRPAFTFEEKEKSHWISVSPLPKEKLWEYYDTGKPFTASNGMDYSLPWKIGTDLEWHQDLAEMLFAIMYPEEWATNIQNYSSLSMFGRPSGLPIFNDWHCDNIKYHNKYFWENVQKAWKINSIVEKVFGVSFDEMKALLKQPNANGQGGGPGLYLLYDGSYWSTRFSNKPNLYQVHYFHGTKDTKKNMHEKDTDKPCSQVVVPKNLTEGANNYPLDFYKSMTVQKPYIKEQRFFGDDQPRWVVRYAEGAELASRVYDPMQVISDFQGDNEVYRYYRDVLTRTNLAEPPEETKPSASPDYFSGTAHYRFGNIYRDELNARWYVFNQAGLDTNDPSFAKYNERSPYSELITFDSAGMDVSFNGANVENLPTLDQAVRAFLWLYQLESLLCTKENSDLDNDFIYGKSALNILGYAHVDVRELIQILVAQNKDPRSNSFACSIAYTDPKVNGTQLLLRCLVNQQTNANIPEFYFWRHYPSNPDNTTVNVTSFGNELITLDDLANPEMIGKYATDSYAICPVSSIFDPYSDDRTARSPRTKVDNDTQNVRKYFYDVDVWNNLEFKTDMWNAPILFFRYTRVKDKGDDNYSPSSVDGHQLSLSKARDWTSSLYGSDAAGYAAVKTYPIHVFDFFERVYMDGQKYSVKTWEQLEDPQDY